MTTHARLGEVFVELADSLVAEFDVVEFLTTLARSCAELIDAVDVGVVVADEAGDLQAVASSSHAAHLLELFEIQRREGPCLDCYRTGVAIANQPLDEDSPWPDFAAEAHRAGYSHVHAVPMRLRGEVIGAVNIFTSDDVELSSEDFVLAQALADVATISLLQEQGIRHARLLNERLRGALDSRVVIEQAKGMLAERRGLEMDAAFELLRSHARNANQKLSVVAGAVLDGSLDDAALG